MGVGRGDTGTRGRGDAELGDAGTPLHGDADTRRWGDAGTRGHGDAETRRWFTRGDTGTRRRGDAEMGGQAYGKIRYFTALFTRVDHKVSHFEMEFATLVSPNTYHLPPTTYHLTFQLWFTHMKSAVCEEIFLNFSRKFSVF